MPETIEQSEMYLTRRGGSGEIQIDTGDPVDLQAALQAFVDGSKKFQEAQKGLVEKNAREAEEQRRRLGMPPTTAVLLQPTKLFDNPPPEETKPIVSDSPVLNGSPELAIPESHSCVFDTSPQSDRPLVSAREPSHSAYDQLNPIPPDDLLDLLANPPADVDAFVDRARKSQPEPGELDPVYAAPAARAPEKVGDPVDLFRGTFTLDVVDLNVPTACVPIAMRRSYRSGRSYFGPLGYGWDHAYNVYLRQLNDGGVALWTGQLREERFRNTGAALEPEPSFAARLEQTAGETDVFAVLYPNGTRWNFERPVGWTDAQRIPLVAIRDRHGNIVRLTYGAINRVTSILDDAGRGLLLHYGSCELLERVTDHTGGREVRYDHDPEIEHLVRVILPATLQYPKGMQTSYEYAPAGSHPAMRHNILRTFDADDRLMLENEFGGPETGWEFNSLVRQRLAGFEFQFEYQQLQYVAPDPLFVDVLATRTLVRPPDGSLHTYTFNYRGDLLDHRFRLNRDGSYRVIAAQWRHDAQGNVTESVGPDGLRTVFTFDSTNPDPCARRNLLRMELAAPFSSIVPSRILFRAQYDSRFQQVRETKDEAGAETKYLYDFDVTPFGASGRLQKVQLPPVVGADGVPQQSVLSFEYNARGQLTAEISAEGRRTELSYLSAGVKDGFLSTIAIDPAGVGLVTAFGYDTAGFASTIESPGGRTTTLRHNALGQVVETSLPPIDGEAATIRTWFDDSGSPVRVERPVGSYSGVLEGGSIVDEYERDELGNTTRVIFAGNTTDRTEWTQRVDHEGRATATWDAVGTRTDRVFADDGTLISETAAAGDAVARTTRYFRDLAGRVTRIVDPWNTETAIAYDVWGRPLRITLPTGAVRALEWGVNDRLIEERIEEEGPPGTFVVRQHMSFAYDARGRLAVATAFSFRDPSDPAAPLDTRYLYDRDDLLRASLLPRGASYAYEFDAARRPSQETDPLGNVRRYGYDAAGDLTDLALVDVAMGGARTRTRTLAYDGRGRLIRSTFLNFVAELDYDDRGLTIERRVPGGTQRFELDAHGRVTASVLDPAGFALRSRFEYDSNGRARRYVDPTGQTTTWDRDALGGVIAIKPPDGTTWNYRADPTARKSEELTPAGNHVIHELVGVGSRLVRVTSFAAAGQESVGPELFTNDGLGRLVQATAGAEVLKRQYDSLGRLIEETTRGQTVRMEYDDAAGTTDLVFPDGRRERTERNPVGQPTRVVLVTPGALGGASGDVLLEIDYSTSGRPLNLTYGNGVEGHLVHDDHDRLIRVEYQKSGAMLDSCRVRYDEDGHRAVVQYLGAPARNLAYGFDRADRLVTARSGFPLGPLLDATAPTAQAIDIAAAQTAAGLAPGVAFVLDDADARTILKGLNGGAIDETYTLGIDHRVTAVGANGIAYNLDGHRRMDSRYAYELDARNRVRRVRDRATSLVVAELEYDPLSRVAAGTIDGEAFERWFAGSTRIHELVGPAPGSARQYSANPLWPSPFCVNDAGGPAFIHQDEGCSTMCVTDSVGAVLERHRYHAFGASSTFAADGVTPLASLRTEAIWRGTPALGTTSLYRMPHRIYDPDTGVFTSRDPLLYADSPSPYSYAAHNPVDFADPTGLGKTEAGAAPAARKFDDSWARSHQTLRAVTDREAEERHREVQVDVGASSLRMDVDTYNDLQHWSRMMGAERKEGTRVIPPEEPDYDPNMDPLNQAEARRRLAIMRNLEDRSTVQLIYDTVFSAALKGMVTGGFVFGAADPTAPGGVDPAEAESALHPGMNNRALLQFYAFQAGAVAEVRLRAHGGVTLFGPMVYADKGNFVQAYMANMIAENPAAARRFITLGRNFVEEPDWIPRTSAGTRYNFRTRENYDLFPLNEAQRRIHFNRPYGSSMVGIYYFNARPVVIRVGK